MFSKSRILALMGLLLSGVLETQARALLRGRHWSRVQATDWLERADRPMMFLPLAGREHHITVVQRSPRWATVGASCCRHLPHLIAADTQALPDAGWRRKAGEMAHWLTCESDVPSMQIPTSASTISAK
jgi:hypothetical protein